MKRILILGCGWLAEEFAHLQLKNMNQVWATTTTEEKYHRLKNDGIFAYVHNFDGAINKASNTIESNPENILAESLKNFGPFDLILTSIPATNRNTVEELQIRFSNVYSLLSRLEFEQHIFLSSVGIYPDMDGFFDESNHQTTHLNPKLLMAEEAMLKLPNTHVFRLGGLFGKQRIFAKYFEDRIVQTGDQPANFIHLEDVCGVLDQALHKGLKETIYNLVTPEHPLKKEVILASAEKYGYKKPLGFQPENSFQKIVSGNKIAQELNYGFKYPSPLYF
ncbi:GDP-L-fucose synthase [Sphingobacterium sp. PU5-4]|uniref:GDP-L-fucose synthase n=1 Tax=Sphingobacterium tenebrionis TaxID=3111775 RepID=A0ABU8I9P5_9SPHI